MLKCRKQVRAMAWHRNIYGAFAQSDRQIICVNLDTALRLRVSPGRRRSAGPSKSEVLEASTRLHIYLLCPALSISRRVILKDR